MTTIVAKTPVRPEANYPVRALVRVESKCSKCITQRSRRMSIIANGARPKASGVASREAVSPCTDWPARSSSGFVRGTARGSEAKIW